MNKNLENTKYFYNFFLLNGEKKVKSSMSSSEEKVFAKNADIT